METKLTMKKKSCIYTMNFVFVHYRKFIINIYNVATKLHQCFGIVGYLIR